MHDGNHAPAAPVHLAHVESRPIEELSGEAFLVLKSVLKAKCLEITSELTGVKGLKSALSALAEQLSAAGSFVGDLPFNTDKMLGHIDDLNAKVVEIDAKVGATTNKEDLPEQQRLLTGCSDSLDGIRKANSDQMGAMRYKKDQAAKEKRQDYNTKYWTITKGTSWLTQGGFHKKCAGYLAKSILAISTLAAGKDDNFFPETSGVVLNPTSAQFNSQVVAVWTPSGCVDGTLGFAFISKMTESNDALDAKAEALSQGCQNNAKWTGSMGNVAGLNIPANFGGLDLCQTQEPGAQGWMFCHQANAKRFSAPGYPLPSIAQLILNRTQVCYVLLSPMHVILSKGIAMADLESFYESKGGATVLESQTILVRVPIGAVLFVPFGWICHFVYFKEDELHAKNSSVKKDHTPSPNNLFRH